MKSKTWAVLAALLALVAAALAAGCGGDDTGSPSAAKVAGNATDRAFVAAMVPHHRSAIDMAAIAKTEATSTFVRNLAANVTGTQNAEITQMQRLDRELANAGVTRGDLGMDSHTMGMDTSTDTLEGAKPFDEKFISLMVPHHEGAIAMARVELDKGANPELKALAGNIISAQEREVKRMRAHAGGASGSDDDAMDDMGTGDHAG